MNLKSAAHGIFAVTLIAIGIIGWEHGGLSLIGEDLPHGMAARRALGLLTDLASIAFGAGLLWRRTAALAARMLLGALLLWLLVLKLRYVIAAPAVEASYQTCGEAAAVTAGAGLLYVALASEWERTRIHLVAGQAGVRIFRSLYALALVAFGLSHVVYRQLTASLVPAWLPWPAAVADVTGFAYLAAAAGLLLGVYPRLAAALSALEMSLFTLLVWVPPIIAGHARRFDWNELFISWTLAAAGWMVTDSYRGRASAAPVRA